MGAWVCNKSPLLLISYAKLQFLLYAESKNGGILLSAESMYGMLVLDSIRPNVGGRVTSQFYLFQNFFSGSGLAIDVTTGVAACFFQISLVGEQMVKGLLQLVVGAD